MSWLNDLYQTYENNSGQIALNIQEKAVLLPIAHSTQNSQVEIHISDEGKFLTANIVPKADAKTIIPVTEDSSSRSGTAIFPHPLEDKLEYIAKDFFHYTGINNAEKVRKYLEQLDGWCTSLYGCKEIVAIKKYIEHGTVIKDLVEHDILQTDERKMLTKVKIEGIEPSSAFVRFRVGTPHIGENKEDKVYENTDIFKAYINYYLSTQKDVDLCYATGNIAPCSSKHPSKIRNTGDKAKLISGNDATGFTFRGRFYNSNQVASVSYEVSQKAHNALKWLIAQQGFMAEDLTVVAWEISGKKIVPLEDDTASILFQDSQSNEQVIYTNITYAQQLKKAVQSYKLDLGNNAEIVVMGLEAATTGRLSIRFYRKISGSMFLDNIYKWHNTCYWQHFYKKNDLGKTIPYVGAASLKDIARVAFGEKNEKMLKNTVERLLLCVVDGRNLPKDIMVSAFNNATRPASYEKRAFWQKAITITCSLIRKYRCDKFKEEWNMALDETCRDRSYLFGRLLGAAQRLEEYSLYLAKEKNRVTSAERLMSQFTKRPCKTWGLIEEHLRPYVAHLKASNHTFYIKEINRIHDLFDKDDFMANESLSELYLLGYNCQLNKKNNDDKENEND